MADITDADTDTIGASLSTVSCLFSILHALMLVYLTVYIF